VEVTPVEFDELVEKKRSEKSEIVRGRVIGARKIQAERFADNPTIYCNSQMATKSIQNYCQIGKAGSLLLKSAMQKLNLSARAYDRILKVSRTIADLGQSSEIKIEHLAEAIQYRSLDRENWAG
jgi:magnesium chelatase family protein